MTTGTRRSAITACRWSDRQVTPPEVIERTVDFLRGSAHQIGSYPGVEQVKLALKAIWPCTTSRPGVGVTINSAPGPSIYLGLDPNGRPVVRHSDVWQLSPGHRAAPVGAQEPMHQHPCGNAPDFGRKRHSVDVMMAGGS
jgi:hypothetical protein